MNILKVSARSNPTAVAGALAGVIRKDGSAEIHAIGAGALNQAIKALTIARGYLCPSGIDLICTPSFYVVRFEHNEKTAIRLLIEPKSVHVLVT